jgi:RNA-directed DNA polymerase
MLWVWAKRQHPHKPRQWVRDRYFADDGYWTFTDGAAQLYCHSATRITRFIKVIGRSSPPDPVQRAYLERRAPRSPVRSASRHAGVGG